MNYITETKAATNQEIKRMNKHNIYHFIRSNSLVSCRDIQKAIGMSAPTIYMNIEELMTDNLICESGDTGSTGGRRGKVYSVIKDAKVAIGLSIKTTSVRADVIDLFGQTISYIEKSKDFERSNDFYQFLGNIIKELLINNHLTDKQILGVDIGIPCLTDPDNKVVTYGRILPITGATNEEFGRYIPFHVRLIHDTLAAGLREFWNIKETSDAFFLLLSQTIGGASFIAGKPYYGLNHRAAEVGHIMIHPGGKQCYCGAKGCADAYLGTDNLLNGKFSNLDAFFQAVDAGDQEATQTLEQYIKDLALLLRSIHLTADCKIILGGACGKYLTKYLNEIYEELKNNYPFRLQSNCIEICNYEEEGISSGAALYSITEYLKTI